MPVAFPMTDYRLRQRALPPAEHWRASWTGGACSSIERLRLEVGSCLPDPELLHVRDERPPEEEVDTRMITIIVTMPRRRRPACPRFGDADMDPTPGSVYLRPLTVIALDAVRKNQLPPKLIMPFQTSPIAPPGTSTVQNLFHATGPWLAGLVEFARLADQRVVEGERDIPRLRGEDGEDRRAFEAELGPGEERGEEGHGDGEEPAPGRTAGCPGPGSAPAARLLRAAT